MDNNMKTICDLLDEINKESQLKELMEDYEVFNFGVDYAIKALNDILDNVDISNNNYNRIVQSLLDELIIASNDNDKHQVLQKYDVFNSGILDGFNRMITVLYKYYKI